MQIGMMPAKLTQILVNIAVGTWKNPPTLLEKEGEVSDAPETADVVHFQHDTSKLITIYDPFMGLGTTAMIANSM
jgi:hypothetical protein